MKPPRVSIAGLMGLVVVVAIGLVGLRVGSPSWAGAISLVCLALLSGAVLKVIFRRGRERATWAGFALFGWIYLALNHGEWLGPIEPGSPFSFTWLLDEIHPRIHALPPEPPPAPLMPPEPYPMYAIPMPPTAPANLTPDLAPAPAASEPADSMPPVATPASASPGPPPQLEPAMPPPPYQLPPTTIITPMQPAQPTLPGSPFWAGDLNSYHQVGHALGALLFASLGALWGRWACSPKEEPAAAVPPSTQSVAAE